MAYRLHHHVRSGEIDCRTKGRVTGHLDLFGQDVPIHLDLKGFPNPDLAGLLLRFTNPEANPQEPCHLHPIQQGQTGELTASRKSRILDCPVEEAWNLATQDLPYPEHLCNLLYLEWYSQRNGRVVLEIPEATVEIIGEPTWRMTKDEAEQQQQEVVDHLDDFIDLLQDSLEEDPPEDEEDF